jgi:hypothetical protein
MGGSLPTRIRVCFNAVETSQFTFNQKARSLSLRHQLRRYAYRVWRFLGSTVSPVSEVWRKCQLCITLWSSVEASGRNSQKTWRPTGRRCTASSRQCQTPYSLGRIRELQWEFLKHPPYSPGLAPSDFHLFGPLKNTLVANVSWWRNGWNGGVEMAETIVKIFL